MSENIKYLENIIDIDFSTEMYLEFCEKNITNKILDRCHIETIPERLNTLIQEFLIEQYNLNKKGIGESKQIVSSVSDNGQTVSFETVGGIKFVSKNAEEFLDKNMSTLIKYRKIGW